MTRVTSVAVAVVEHQNRFLIGQRSSSVPLGGLWEIPGGKIAADESPPVAAARECLEETGLRVEVAHCLVVHLQQYEHGDIKLYFFACRPLDPDASPNAPFEWVARDQLSARRFPDGNRPLLQRLLGD